MAAAFESRSSAAVAIWALLMLAALPPCVASASRTAAASLPTCPASDTYGRNPHPNCLLRPFTSNEAKPITGTVKVTRQSKTHGGWFYVLTVTTDYSDPGGNVCPAGAISYSLIPCHYPGVTVALMGLSVHGQKDLAPAPVAALETDPCPPKSPCVRHYQIGASTTYGRMTFVFEVTQGDVTRAANDLGVAGFDRAVTVDVPHYSGKPPACLSTGKC